MRRARWLSGSIFLSSLLARGLQLRDPLLPLGKPEDVHCVLSLAGRNVEIGREKRRDPPGTPADHRSRDREVLHAVHQVVMGVPWTAVPRRLSQTLSPVRTLSARIQRS